MGLFSKIAGAEKTFAGWMVKEYAKFYKAEPTIIHVVDTVIKYAIPAISIIVGIEAGSGAAAEVNAIGTEAQKDLLAVSGLVYDFGATPTAASMVQGVSNNLASLLTAGHITNSSNVANTTKIIETLGTLAQALIPSVSPTSNL